MIFIVFVFASCDVYVFCSVVVFAGVFVDGFVLLVSCGMFFVF